MYPLVVLIGIGIAAVGTLLDPPGKKGVDKGANSVPGSDPSDNSDKSGQNPPTPPANPS